MIVNQKLGIHINSSKSLDPKETLRNELNTLKKSRAYSPEYVEKRTKEINLELNK